MNERTWQDRFTQDVDEILKNRKPSISDQADPEYLELLEIAQILAGADASRESRVKVNLRVKLLQRVQVNAASQSERGLPRRSVLPLRQVLSPVLLILVVLGLAWVIRNFLPGVFQPPVAVGPAQTSKSPAIISMQSSPEEIIDLAINARWQSVWAEGSLQELGSTGDWQTTFFQAWIDRSGLGRIIESAPQPGLLDRRPAMPVRFVNISDGERMVRYDAEAGAFDAAFDNMAFAAHPLENAGPYMSLFYPYFLGSEGGEFRVAGENMLAGRPVVVMEWIPVNSGTPRHRFQVDMATGMLLNHQVLAEDGVTIIREVQIQKVVVEASFPPALATIELLPQAQFEDGPQLPEGFENQEFTRLPTPAPLPQPTPYTVPASPTVNLEIVGDPAAIEPSTGELYYQVTDSATSSVFLLRISSVCAASQSTCPAHQVTALSGVLTAPIYWSPNGSLSAQFDTSSNRIIHLADPAQSQWQILAENVLPQIQVAIWSPDNKWAAIALLQPDGTSSQLTLLGLGGVFTLASDLTAMKIPLGWIDANTLLFVHGSSPDKGLAGALAEITPGVYKVYLDSGLYEALPGLAGYGLLANYPAVSPDGRTLAVSMGDPAELALYDILSSQLTPLGINLAMPSWSPDGQWIAGYWVENNMAVLGVYHTVSGELRRLFEWPSVPVFTWSPDSLYLAIEAGPNADEFMSHQFLVHITDSSLREILLPAEYPAMEMRYPAFRP